MTKDIKLIIIFGSRARGTTGKHSDVDVAVLADHSLTIREKADLAVDIAKKLGVSEDVIDLVDLWSAPPLLQYQVANSGKLLKGTGSDFLRFKVLAWKCYQDTAKFRRAREKALAQHIK